MADNLAYSDYVIVVEGITDKGIITSVIQHDEVLKRLLNNNIITIHSIGGTNNLKAELFSMERYMCKYIVLLDNDEAGKNAANAAQNQFGISSDQFRFFIVDGMRESELEDLFESNCYKEFLLSKYKIDITKGQFRNRSKKWSKRIEELAGLSGRVLSDSDIDNIKTAVSELVVTENDAPHLSTAGNELIQSIVEKIKHDVC